MPSFVFSGTHVNARGLRRFAKRIATMYKSRNCTGLQVYKKYKFYKYVIL